MTNFLYLLQHVKFSVFNGTMAISVHLSWQRQFMEHVKFSSFFYNLANFVFEQDHGKLSVCIMANAIFGAWQFPILRTMVNFLSFFATWQIFFFEGTMANLTGPWQHQIYSCFKNRYHRSFICPMENLVQAWQMQFKDHGNVLFPQQHDKSYFSFDHVKDHGCRLEGW